MGEYRVMISYDQPRRFPIDKDGRVIPSGELVRFEEKAMTAFVRPEVPLEIEPGKKFEAHLLFISQIESQRPFVAGQELELVAPEKGDLKLVGRCVVLEKIA